MISLLLISTSFKSELPPLARRDVFFFVLLHPFERPNGQPFAVLARFPGEEILDYPAHGSII